jgi:hypothetical protein
MLENKLTKLMPKYASIFNSILLILNAISGSSFSKVYLNNKELKGKAFLLINC